MAVSRAAALVPSVAPLAEATSLVTSSKKSWVSWLGTYEAVWSETLIVSPVQLSLVPAPSKAFRIGGPYHVAETAPPRIGTMPSTASNSGGGPSRYGAAARAPTEKTGT